MTSILELMNYRAAISFKDTHVKTYLPTQLGSHIEEINDQTHDVSHFDLIIMGCGEFRGQDTRLPFGNGPDKVREEFYKLHCWHENIKIGDFGNLIEGASLNDTRAALRTVVAEFQALGKKVLILGGSHDLTLQQYEVFKMRGEIIDFSVIDMLVDLDSESENRYDSYLMDALTFSPNFVRHFNLIGFQSYYVNPNLIETFDKLRFDCLRVGKAREDIEQIEPMLRNSHIISLDINAIRSSDAPANKLASPNGFYGDEICKLTRFAGMSTALSSFGIYGYQPELDQDFATAKLLAQMIWYFVDGLSIQKNEADINDRSQFLEYQIPFTDTTTLFLKSKTTNRWWMQLPDEKFIACTYQDYLTACNNEIPERWLREIERLV
jgi:formiminoglutamase